MLLMNRTLLRMAKGLWGWIFAITLLKLVTLAGTAGFARILSGFLGNLSSPHMTAVQAGSAILSALIMALVMLGSELLTGEAEYRCTAKARTRFRADIFTKVLDLDVGNIEKIGPVSAITSSVDGIESMTVYYSKYLPGLLYCLIAPFYMFFQLRSASPAVAVVLLVISFILMPVNNLFRKHIENLKGEYWSSLEDMTGYYLENVQGLTTLKLYGQDELRTDGLCEKAYHFNSKIMAVMKVNFSSFLLTDGLIYTSVILALAMAGWQLAAGTIDFSATLMILMLSFSFFGSVRSLMNATHSALAGVSAADKAEKLMEIDTNRPYDPNLPKEKNAFDGIRMEHVSFSYTGRCAALKDISIDIPRGKVVALAGLSGCGKSTVASLLMRFSDLDSGRILLEGRDYTSLDPESLRKRIIMVPQFVTIFSGTIADNLRLAAPNATEQEMLDALKDVHLLDWVISQPDGLDTNVGDAGGKLSGGQRQKIGIARALLCRAEYIIFDESTSSVDMVSEQEIWNCIRKLSLTRTLVIISHRLSSIENADHIYVLDGGTIAEHGIHADLMSNNGLYHRLVEEQSALEEHGETLWQKEEQAHA